MHIYEDAIVGCLEIGVFGIGRRDVKCRYALEVHRPEKVHVAPSLDRRLAQLRVAERSSCGLIQESLCRSKPRPVGNIPPSEEPVDPKALCL